MRISNATPVWLGMEEGRYSLYLNEWCRHRLERSNRSPQNAANPWRLVRNLTEHIVADKDPLLRTPRSGVCSSATTPQVTPPAVRRLHGDLWSAGDVSLMALARGGGQDGIDPIQFATGSGGRSRNAPGCPNLSRRVP